MLYFEFVVDLEKPIGSETDKPRFMREAEFTDNLSSSVEEVNQTFPSDTNFYIINIRGSRLTIAGSIGIRNIKEPEELVKDFLEKLGHVAVYISSNEITSEKFSRYIHQACRYDFLEDEDLAMERASLPSYRESMKRKFYEMIADGSKSREALYDECMELPCGSSLQQELDRIFSGERRAFMGHPVHYIMIVDKSIEKAAVNILVDALYLSGRVKSRRVSLVKATPNLGSIFDASENKEKYLDLSTVKCVYHSCHGGTIAIKPGNIDYDIDRLSSDSPTIEELASCVSANSYDCLTILIFSKQERKVAELIRNRLNKIRFVLIQDEPCNYERAKQILEKMANNDSITDCSSLLSSFEENDAGYYMSDLDKFYKAWHDAHLCLDFFPQYKDISFGKRPEKKPVGNAYDELQNLIGLEKVKSVVKQAIDFNRFQKLYFDRGFSAMKPSRHMVFTGNPGTAKTTVARLFATIMKDNNVIPEGKLIEVGRNDLVGKYVGWTAKLVEETFERAKGSVLFIDEAYSLSDGRNGDFGDEAINTIVQMMENQRDETIVIFAGYPDRMNNFLDRNPGLRSRIAFHVDFPDYNENELVDILNLISGQYGMSLTPGVESKVREILSEVMVHDDFGNGRFIRNLFERAMMAQASRVMVKDEADIKDSDLTTLIPEDFTMPDMVKDRTKHRPIGFAF